MTIQEKIKTKTKKALIIRILDYLCRLIK